MTSFLAPFNGNTLVGVCFARAKALGPGDRCHLRGSANPYHAKAEGGLRRALPFRNAPEHARGRLATVQGMPHRIILRGMII